MGLPLITLSTHVLCAFTSRKHGKKEPQSFVHCASFDHPDMHSFNDYKFVFLSTEVLGIWGLLIYYWKGLEITFPTVYNKPPKLKNCRRKRKKKEKNVVV